MNKTFRGTLADGAQDRIRLSTNNGLTGYKISKFEMMLTTPGATTQESVMKIYTQESSTIDGVINFTDPLLLAAGYFEYNSGSSVITTPYQIVFDNIVFNQDIYVTHTDLETGESCNYHIELEKVKLDVNEATVATLKDMRGRE